MPNQAMPWRSLLCWYLTISAVALAIGLWFFSRGLTLILPFSGLEVLALGFGLYASAWKSNEKQVITIEPERIEIARGWNSPVEKDEFQRAWAHIVLEPPKHPWYPSRLLIRSRGTQVEVGRFLNEEERQGFAMELRNALGRKDFNHPSGLT